MVIAKLKHGPVEIKDVGDLLKVVKEARAEHEPLVIQVDDGNEIVFAPAPQPTKRRRRLTPEERTRKVEEDFWAAFGSWRNHIDRDEFMKQVREGRSSDRPLVVVDVRQE